MTFHSRPRERGSAAGVVALLLLVLCLALGAYIAWGLFLTPQLVAVRPDPVAAGSSVTLHGGRFGSSPGQNIVIFGDQTGRVVRATPTELDAVVPDLGLPAGRQARVPVRVLVDGRASESVELTIGVVPPPPIPAPTPEATPVAESASPEPGPSPSAEPGASPSSEHAPARPTGETKAVKAVASPATAPSAPTASPSAAALPPATRAFVLGKTQAEGVPAQGGVKAFDTRDVAVRKPIEVPGRVEVEATPAQVRTGDPLNLKIYLVNEGKKPIRIQSLNLATTVDDVRESAPAAPLVKEVGPGERALVAEVTNPWRPASRRWRFEVQIVSARGETYTNILSWR